MSVPRWTTAPLRRLARANPAEADVLIGDLEEAHRARVARHGSFVATLLTTLETADVVLMLARRRLRVPRIISLVDLKLAFRMLRRYPVLTLVGSGSLAFAIAIGAAAFAFISLFLWPRLPLPDGDQIVIVQQHDRAANQRRHDRGDQRAARHRREGGRGAARRRRAAARRHQRERRQDRQLHRQRPQHRQRVGACAVAHGPLCGDVVRRLAPRP
jgi:hypothetical protein